MDSRENTQNENAHYIYHMNDMGRCSEKATAGRKGDLNQGDPWGKVTDLQVPECCLLLL